MAIPPPDALDEPVRQVEEDVRTEVPAQVLIEGHERLEEQGFEWVPDLEDQEEKRHEHRGQDDVAVKGMHDDAVDLPVPRHLSPMLDPAALLGDLQGLVVALGGDDLVGRSTPAGFDAEADAVDLGLEVRFQLAQHHVAEEPVGLDHLDRREPAVGHDRKFRGNQPRQLLDAALDVPGPGPRPGPPGMFEGLESLVQQFFNAPPPGCDNGNDRHPQMRGQLLRIDPDPFFFG